MTMLRNSSATPTISPGIEVPRRLLPVGDGMRSRAIVPVLAVALLLPLGACAPALHPACTAGTDQALTSVQLFFGRAIAGRADVSDTEWSSFAAAVLTPAFPDGFTVTRGIGQWRDPGTGAIVQEGSMIVLIAARPDGDLFRRVEQVKAAYRARFHQQSVGQLVTPACGSF